VGAWGILVQGKTTMHKRVSTMGGIVLLLGGISLTYAWNTGECTDLPLKVHARIAENVLDHPSIRPTLVRLGLNRNEIVSKTRVEPQCYFGVHPSWTSFLNQSYLSWPLNNQTVAAILHVAGDSGVASCHSPANEVWCNTTAERILEQNAELYDVPGLNSVYAGQFSQKLASFHDEAVALARRYQAWWAKKPVNCPPDCKLDAFARQGQLLGQKLGQAALLHYFEKKAAARTQ